MTTARGSNNVESGATDDDAATAAIVRRALEMLDAVKQLLDALSPSEIQATAARVFLGRLDGRPDVLWNVYGNRHQALVAVFASQHAAFTQVARAFFERRRASGSDPPSDSEGPGKERQ